MNRTRTACLAIFLGVATVAGVTGCAGDRTHKSFGQVIDDATLTARVKTAFAKDDEIQALRINIETYRGVVQLSGFVDSQEVARHAAEVAKDVPGVVSVKNDLQVKPAAPA